MRVLMLLAALLPLPLPALAGSAADFDFWIGSWELSWPKDSKGYNLVTKILDDKVVLESFDGRPATPLVGRSLSVYDAKADVWRQTWVDNQGGYLDFEGGMQPDGRMVLSREAERDGKRFLQRMVWFDIGTDGFTWHWERSDDGGETWKLVWPIQYRRAAP